MVIILLWLLGFFSEGILKFNAPIEKACNDVRFKAVIARAEAMNAPQLQISNTGSIQIFDFSIKYIRENKETQTGYVGKPLEPGTSLTIDLIPGSVETKEIQLYPVLLGSTKSNKNKQKICFDNAQSIFVSQVNP
jgi:hypothetical protein